ncbi:glycosyltransferase family 4 protein [Aliivibrio sp. S2TY2]|uniref:glycosyltransferase family 4 protein n=1 Tax=unclassified Aliivibrio TaxID=2645654 RepID=UPI002378A0CF|nr:MULTISPECIES: glycosyltransferase family 4 protein [unclassified Aliivibrio]MDD9174887.1 glycosyltransferase family 4 protein [Aliivibrio sp. S3TY1]MDD9192166.1 glycosyltransferase family 4 protein [Aliivibrio sp. S2TY2]
MRILVLSFYYQPDLCAGSFRTTSLIEQLKQHDNVEIEIVTTMPNRYASFSATANCFDQVENVTINRIELPSHNSGMLDQIKSFTRFYIEAIKLTKNKKYDLVFATSSRLFTAFLGARLAKKKRIPLYLDIRDIFVDTIKDVLNPKVSLFAKPILSLIESYTFNAAKHINLVSRGFESYFVQRFKQAKYSWFTNGIDDEFLGLDARAENNSEENIILYAGNIGEGQGLHTILPGLANGLDRKFKITVIGDGGRKPILERDLSDVENVNLLPPVQRKELSDKYMSADVLFLHLNDYPAFKKVLPSKIFEYAATGKPILAGVSGYAAKFITDEVSNAEVFHPGDAKGALSALDKLNLEYTDRSEFINNYTRTHIMKEMAKSIIQLRSKNNA